MGNGNIVGVTLVHEPGADLHDHFNIVIVSEGYTAGRLAQFQIDVTNTVTAILQSPAIDKDAITVTRIDVASKEGGVDVPGLPPVDTYFDGEFDPATSVLSVSNGRVNDAVTQEIAQLGSDIHVHKIVVLVDTLLAGGGGSPVEAGGSGASIAVASNQVDSQTVVHELGHAFGLADEYSGAPWMGTDPPPPNVSRTAVRDQLPWHDLLSSGVVLPTPDNTPASTIGAFEIQTAPDDRFRPMHDCKMKSISAAFCKVCEGSIRSTLKG